MNRCLQEVNIPEWMTMGKTTHFQKKKPYSNSPKQLKTYNMPIYDVENTNGTNYGGDLLLVNDIYLTPPLGQDMTQGRFF